jgi:hypothetical protein
MDQFIANNFYPVTVVFAFILLALFGWINGDFKE